LAVRITDARIAVQSTDDLRHACGDSHPRARPLEAAARHAAAREMAAPPLPRKRHAPPAARHRRRAYRAGRSLVTAGRAVELTECGVGASEDRRTRALGLD